jgi:hypothetical protein
MATDSNTPPPPTPEQVAAAAAAGASGFQSDVDARKATALRALGLMQQARASQLNRAAARATAQHGASSSQAASAKAAVAAANLAAASYAVAHQEATTPAPKVAAAGWALHGRVYDSNLAPLAQYSVYLADAHNTFLKPYGVAYTDATGYFLLSYDGVGAPTPAPALYLQVADPNAMPVFASAKPFQPTLGAATYQVVKLPPGAPPLGDPPAQVRAVTMPNLGMKPKSGGPG